MVKADEPDVKRDVKQENVWAAGENKAVGLAFSVGCWVIVATVSRSGYVSMAYGVLVFFSLWFIVALLQIATRALMVSATAMIMAQQDGARQKGRRDD